MKEAYFYRDASRSFCIILEWEKQEMEAKIIILITFYEEYYVLNQIFDNCKGF